jgi:arylsulfatase A-like enzyme
LYDPHLDIDLSGYTGNLTMPTGTNQFTYFPGEIARYGPRQGTPWPWPATRVYTGPARQGFDTDEMRHLIHGYMACVSYVDAQLGLILDALEDPDGDPSTDDTLTNSTVVVYFGAHPTQDPTTTWLPSAG